MLEFFSHRCCVVLLAAASPALFMQSSEAAEEDTLPAVTAEGGVFKKSQGSVSTRSETLPTQVTVIDDEDIRHLNVQNNADLFRKTPGVQAYSFGQGDLGNPFIMRGFSSDHGSSTAVYIDGVPQNLPSSSIGANGMAEYGWLTADMIERIEVIKGPVSALYGDQALAGAINIITKTTAKSSVAVTAGRYGTGQINGTYSGLHNGIKVFAVAEGYHTDGYRDRSNYDRGNAFLKLTMPVTGGELSLRATYYNSDWNAPGYLVFDRLVAGLVSPKTSPYRDGGDGKRQSLVLNYRPTTEAGLVATVYADRIERTRFASFAPSGTQSETRDQRDVFGARALYNWVIGTTAVITTGAELRHDNGDAGAFRTVDQQRTGLVLRDYGLRIDAYSVFAQAQVKVAEPLKLIGGLRYDRFKQEIDNRPFPANSGSGSQSITTPRIGLVYTPVSNIDLYANIGTGFRSAAATELSPPLATGRANFDLDLPKIRSRDAGINARFGALTLSGSVYHSDLEKEIRETVPGSGIYASIGDTERNGYELSSRYQFGNALALFGSYSRVNARVKNPAVAGQDRVTGNPDKLITAGVEYGLPLRTGKLSLDTYFQRVGEKPYYVGNAERASLLYDVYNARVSYEQDHSTYTVYGIFQPREFASDSSGANINPKPKTDIGVTYRYTF